MRCVLRGISKRYGERTVVQPADYEFIPGEITCVIGPNGSGKSTLIRMVSFLEKPDAGVVEYHDDGNLLPPGLSLKRRLTAVSQAPLMFNTTVYKNIAYGLRLRGLSFKEMDERATEALELGGLTHLKAAKAKTLSGGEAQRAAMVRAYALRPEVIFLDEPFSNLDPEGGQLMERLVLKMRDYGAAVILVTHNLFQARRLSSRIYFIYQGKLVESGQTGEFFDNPREELTKKFVSGDIIF